jgi:hypothetical protein
MGVPGREAGRVLGLAPSAPTCKPPSAAPAILRVNNKDPRRLVTTAGMCTMVCVNTLPPGLGETLAGQESLKGSDGDTHIKR